MRKRRYLQDWEKTAIIEAYRNGEKLEAIQAEFNLGSVSYPTRLARRAGIPLRGTGKRGHPGSSKKRDYERRKQIATLRQQGLHR